MFDMYNVFTTGNRQYNPDESFRVKWSSDSAGTISDLTPTGVKARVVLNNNQISQFGVSVRTNFGEIRPDDTE